MKKIYSLLTALLVALPLGIMLLFTNISWCTSEAENLEAWAKMYEDMNQASGGEIEKLMKEMEQSGELDALMKELEQSGELDTIIDAMVKSTPQEFMQNLEQEIAQEQNAQPAPAFETLEPVGIPKAPAVPTMPTIQVDKNKLKQVQALLNSIVSKIASIRQKAAIRTSVQNELNPWEYILNDITYYLTTIEDEELAKYLQQPEFAKFYDSLVSLNATLSVEEPRFQVEEILEAEFEDPYLILGFSTSNISKAEAEKRYLELIAKKNPFAVKDKLKRQGVPAAELETQFKQAQQEYNKIFDAYKRIEQKETSAQAFLAILQALHTAVYRNMIIDDAKRLLAKYDPEALKIKEAQEAKEKEARDYRSRVASQRPEFIPPIFDWGSLGNKNTDFGEPSENFRGSDGFEPRIYPDFDRNADRMAPLSSDEAKNKEKGKGKDGKKDDKGKKDEKGKDNKKDGGDKDKKKDGAKEAKPSADLLTPKIKQELQNLKPVLESTGNAINGLFPNPAIGVVHDDKVNIGHMKYASQKAEEITKKIAKDVEELGKLKDDKDKELKKYYETVEKAFNDTIINDTKLKGHLDKLFAHSDTAAAPTGFSDAQKNAYFGIGAGSNNVNNIENLQKELTQLVYATTDSDPKLVKGALGKGINVIKDNETTLRAVRGVGGTVTAKASIAISDITKNLDEAVKRIDTSKNKPAIKMVQQRFNKDIRKVITDTLVNDPKSEIIDDLIELYVPNPVRRSPVGQPGIPMPISTTDKEKIGKLLTAYEKLEAIAQAI